MLSRPVVDRLKDQIKDLRKVAGAANFASAHDDIKGEPRHAYVIPANDSAQPNRADTNGAVMQWVSERFSVALAVSNRRDPRGEHAINNELESLRSQVMAALLGYVPANGYDPIEYVSGNLLQLTPGVLWWSMTFSTGYLERNY